MKTLYTQTGCAECGRPAKYKQNPLVTLKNGEMVHKMCKGIKKRDMLNEWVKDWSIRDIIHSTVMKGIEFMGGTVSSEETDKFKKAIVAEIERRIKTKKK